MLLEVVTVVLLLWMALLRWQQRGMVKLWNQLQNDYKLWPIIGHAYMFLGSDEDRMKVFQSCGKKAYDTGGLLAMWQGSKLYVNVSDAEVADLVLKACLEKDDVMKVSRMLTGNGSVFAPVRIWRPRRKFLAPTFSQKNLVQFAAIFSNQSVAMVDQLSQIVGKGTVSVWKYITSYSMDSVCESTLGVRVNAQMQPEQPFLTAFEEICKLDAARLCQPWLYNDTLYKMLPYGRQHLKYKREICGFIDKVIKNKRKDLDEAKNKATASYQEKEKELKTFLELLITSTGGDQGYTDLELLEETLVLVLAGTDTSAVGTSFAAVMLSRHPDVQKKVYAELCEVFGETERPVVAEDLPRLKYLEAAVKETIRLYPPVPVIVRKVLKDLQLPSGLVLPKNCGLLINIWAIHRNPKYWGGDADEFRPERFLEGPVKHPAAFIPFSYGPRGCLGYKYAMMSMKTALATLVRRYRLLPAAPLPATAARAPLRVKFDIMMRHVDNFELQLERRQK